MKHLFLLILTVLLNGTISHAKGGIGNGGFILECIEDGKTFYQLYDYDEQRKNFSPYLGNGKTTEEKINYVINRLMKVNPTRAKLFQGYLRTLKQDIETLTENEKRRIFVPVTDLGNANIPENCGLKQLGQQYSPEQRALTKEKPYALNKELYDEIETAGFTDVTAGFWLHEFSYREALEHNEEFANAVRSLPIYSGYHTFQHDGLTKPLNVRYLNALIASKKMEDITQMEYNRLLLIQNSIPNKPPIIITPAVDFGNNLYLISEYYNAGNEDMNVLYSKVSKGTPTKFKTPIGRLACNAVSFDKKTNKIKVCRASRNMNEPGETIQIDGMSVEFKNFVFKSDRTIYMDTNVDYAKHSGFGPLHFYSVRLNEKLVPYVYFRNKGLPMNINGQKFEGISAVEFIPSTQQVKRYIYEYSKELENAYRWHTREVIILNSTESLSRTSVYTDKYISSCIYKNGFNERQCAKQEESLFLNDSLTNLR